MKWKLHHPTQPMIVLQRLSFKIPCKNRNGTNEESQRKAILFEGAIELSG